MILITGSNGFIGNALCSSLSLDEKVIGLDLVQTNAMNLPKGIIFEHGDITNTEQMHTICKKYHPNVIIHCAGIAHQKMGSVSNARYFKINSEATENLAITTAKENPDVRFIFLSSASVYGEENGSAPITEDSICSPSSDYALSKLDAERRLVALSEQGMIHNLVILRLAPVYDQKWTLNLDRRVFLPTKIAYVRYGSGRQSMSALARPNLLDFICFLLKYLKDTEGLTLTNVCDKDPYEFNKIIEIFKQSESKSIRPTVYTPLILVWLATRFAGIVNPKKRKWFFACYDKIASDLVLSNKKMLSYGFIPQHSMETIFLSKTFQNE
jgi:nucleoside-diphosphate-sugar epimerase